MLTKQELQNISNLLYTGKWGMSLQESNQTVTPLINKLAKEIDGLKPKEAKNARKTH